MAADQKLVLKDGTDQQVRSYEVVGDRVRYYSLERRQWEEVPASLVDWEATEEANRTADPIPEVELEAPPQLEVAPGLPLPEKEGVYAYDGKSLVRLEQSQGVVKNDRARNLLGAIIPGVKGRAWVELRDSAAKISLSGPQPVFYLQLSPLSPGGYGLVRLETKQDRRVVGEIQIHPITGKLSESQQIVPSALKPVPADRAPEGLSLLRLSPQEPLRPGEYAVVEFLEEGRLNLFVWDFRYPAEPQPATIP